MEISVKGLRVRITAGGSGIGRAIAETFDAEGARVHMCDVVEEYLQELRCERPGIASTIADGRSGKSEGTAFAAQGRAYRGS